MTIIEKFSFDLLKYFFDLIEYKNLSVYYWTSGNSLSIPNEGYVWYLTNPKQMIYQQWAKGQPNFAKSEYCVQFAYDGKDHGWLDNVCDVKSYFICEPSNVHK